MTSEITPSTSKPAGDATVDPRRHLIITANPSRLAAVREMWMFRGVFVRFAVRDITLRYRQTALGVAWVILQPLFGAGVFTFVFGTVANLKGPEGVPYFIFSLVGTITWTLFSQVITRASGALVGNAQLVSKVYFPRMLIPLSTLAAALLDFAVAAALLCCLLLTSGVGFRAGLILAPLWVFLLIALAVGVGLGAGALMVKYRDVGFVLPVAVQFLLYASPVAYALSAVPAGSRTLYEVNPLTGLFEGLRWSVFGSRAPGVGLSAYSLSVTLAILAVGIWVFTRAEKDFADVI